MANYELSGKLFEKFPTVAVSDKYSKREFVVETEENNYKQQVKLQLSKDRCSVLDRFNIGDEVKAVFNINGRRWEKDGKVSYFNSLDAWKIESVGAANTSQPPANEPVDDRSETPDDDLPFN